MRDDINDSDRLARIAVPLGASSNDNGDDGDDGDDDGGARLSDIERARLQAVIDAGLAPGGKNSDSSGEGWLRVPSGKPDGSSRSGRFIGVAAVAATAVAALMAGFFWQGAPRANDAPMANHHDVDDHDNVVRDAPAVVGLTWDQARDHFDDCANGDFGYVASLDLLALSDHLDAANVAAAAGALTGRDQVRHGMLLAAAGNHDDALRAFDTALALPDAPAVVLDARVERARSLIALGREQEAAAGLDVPGVAEVEQSVPLFMVRAEARRAIGDRTGAMADIDAVLRVDDDNAAAHNLRGLIRLDAKSAQEAQAAADDFTLAMQCDPTNPDYPRNRATARRRFGDAKGAETDLQRVRELLVAHGAFGGGEFALPDFDIEVDGKTYPATYGAFTPSAVSSAQAGAATKYPLMVYLHGGGGDAFNKQGTATIRAWEPVCEQKGYFCICPNSLRRGWQRPSIEHSIRFIIAAIKDLASREPVDVSRVIISGGSAGSDFTYTSGVQLAMKDAGITCIGCLPIVPGPPNMVGVQKGELAKVAAFPFLNVCGRKDTIRKAGAWQAHNYLREHGAISGFVEMPDRAHEFPSAAELITFIEWFEALAGANSPPRWFARATAARTAGDVLAASEWLEKVLATDVPAALRKQAQEMWDDIAAQARADWLRATIVDEVRDPGEEVETAWQCMVRYARFPEGKLAAERFATISTGRDAMRAWNAWVDSHRWESGTPDGTTYVEVQTVDADGAAAKLGLQARDIILSVNGTAITGNDQLIKLLGTVPAGSTYRLVVRRYARTATGELQRAGDDWKHDDHTVTAPAGKLGITIQTIRIPTPR